MKILVTGGAGYIGSALTAHLLRSNHEVTVYDKLIYGGESLLGSSGHPRFRLVVGDVRDRDLLAKTAQGMQAVLHLAAIVGEPACALDEAAAQDINYGGTAAALSVAVENGVERFIFVSTCSNYGIADTNKPVSEDAPLKPLSRYASSKVDAERLVLASEGRLCPTVLRLGTICGVSARMRFDLLVSDMARAAALKQAIRIFAPEAWRPFLHVRDAAAVLEDCLLAATPQVRNQVFNVVGENCQKKHLVDLVKRHYPAAKVEVTDKQSDPRDYQVSGAKLARQLGIRPGLSVEEAFVETARAVENGVFRDPMWPGYSAIPSDVAKLR